MDKESKIKCDCGFLLEESKTVLDNLETKTMICPSYKFTTFTKSQAEEYIQLRKLSKIMNNKNKYYAV